MFYRGGVQTIVSDLVPDAWKVDVIKQLVCSWGYEEHEFRGWCKMEEIVNEFVQVNQDHIADEVAMYDVSRGVDGQLYVEHNVTDMSVKVDMPHFVDLNGSNEEDEDKLYMYSSDDGGAKGVKFDDSEDERATALNDGFAYVEVNAPENGTNRVDVGGKSVRIKTCASKSPLKKNTPKKKLRVKMLTHGKKDDDEVEEYHSDELDISDPDNSDHENGPKYPKLRKEQLNTKYEFKLGMEFNSVWEYKDAIIEWNVLNGYQIKMPKNELGRVRVICKQECGYLVFCSQVGTSHTYQIKTYQPQHTCSRTVKNKSTCSRWVAHFAVVKKLQTNRKVTIEDIMDDMRKNHAMGITKGRAWKGKQIAQKIVEGDVDGQYSMIWRYAAELTRVYTTNTVKVNVERPNPGLQLRFGSFYFCFDGFKKGFTNVWGSTTH